MEIKKMMRKRRSLFARVRLCVLFTMVLILPCAGMAQDDNRGSEKEDASPVLAQSDADAAQDADKAEDKADKKDAPS
jgi:hypothetical protein